MNEFHSEDLFPQIDNFWTVSARASPHLKGVDGRYGSVTYLARNWRVSVESVNNVRGAARRVARDRDRYQQARSVVIEKIRTAGITEACPTTIQRWILGQVEELRRSER